MKTKKFEKKLVLNKKTIVNLNSKEMLAINAGILPRTATNCLGTCGQCTCRTC